jgi:hypothetical protein
LTGRGVSAAGRAPLDERAEHEPKLAQRVRLTKSNAASDELAAL